MKWFKHDSDASLDAKLKRVRQKYGMEGYGLYWYCLELVAQTVEKHNLTFELEHDAELIGIDTNIHQERVQEMMSDFIKWRLFENTDGVITCLKMASRTDEYTQQLMRSQDTLPILSLDTPDNIRGKVRGIRREEKRREESKQGRFTPPTFSEVSDYCNERKNRINPQSFIDYYATSGWTRGKNKIKDWKACIRTWEQRENESPKKQKDQFAGAI